MRRVFPTSWDEFLIVYFDDLLVFSSSLEEHFDHLERVLKQLEAHEMKVKLSKCTFSDAEISFLGHFVGHGRRFIDPEKVKAIVDMPAPTSVPQVRRFHGLINRCRDHLPMIADVATPLLRLIRKGAVFKWGKEEQEAFEKIKEMVANAVSLELPDEELPWIMQTDASDHAVGAVLMQEKVIDKTPVIVAFASRRLNDAERNYPTHEREFLAIYWAVTEHFRHYLEGRPCLIETDHQPLRFIPTQPHLSRRMTRWVEELQNFDVKIKYIRGEDNKLADLLSRPFELNSIFARFVKGEVVQLTSLMIVGPLYQMNTIIGSDGPDAASNVGEGSVFKEDWPTLIIELLENRPMNVDEGLKDYLEKEKKNFEYDSETQALFRKVNGELKMFIPYVARAELVYRVHAGNGHLHWKAVIERLREKYWWPYMARDVQAWLSVCVECQLFARRHLKPSEKMHVPDNPEVPFRRWALDWIGPLTPTDSGMRWILVGIELNTRWVEAKAYTEATAENISRFIYENIVTRFGAPSEILTDRGRNFMSNVLMRYLKILMAKHFRTSPFHPRSNGKVENANGSLIKIISKATKSAKHKWDEFIDEALFIIRTRKHNITGHSPFYLMYGVQPQMPGDSTKPFCLNERDPKDVAEIRARMFEEFGEIRAAAAERSKLSADEVKLRYDKLIKEDPLKVGEWVLLHKPYVIKEKFKPNWMGPYELIESTPSGVYKLRDPTGKILDSLIHRDLLKRCNVNERPTSLWTDNDLEEYDDEDGSELFENQGRSEMSRVPQVSCDSLDTPVSHNGLSNSYGPEPKIWEIGLTDDEYYSCQEDTDVEGVVDDAWEIHMDS